MVKIRLRRVGAKKKPQYRLVVADARSPRDGAFIEIIGHYNPLTDPETVVIAEDRARHWLERGAQPTDTAARLLAKVGIIEESKARKEKMEADITAKPKASKKKAKAGVTKKSEASKKEPETSITEGPKTSKEESEASTTEESETSKEESEASTIEESETNKEEHEASTTEEPET